MELVMFGLTVALVFLVFPGVIVKVPLKNIYAVAAVHAVVFTVLYYYLCIAAWNSYEGFVGTPPKCPNGQTYLRSLGRCATQTYTNLTDTTPICSTGKTFYPAINKCANIGYTEQEDPTCTPPKMFVKTLGKCVTASYTNAANPINPNGCPGSLQFIDSLNQCGNIIDTPGAMPTCDAGSIFSVATNTCNVITPARISNNKWDTSIYDDQIDNTTEDDTPIYNNRSPVQPQCSNSRMFNPATCKCGTQNPTCPNNYSLGEYCYCWPKH